MSVEIDKTEQETYIRNAAASISRVLVHEESAAYDDLWFSPGCVHADVSLTMTDGTRFVRGFQAVVSGKHTVPEFDIVAPEIAGELAWFADTNGADSPIFMEQVYGEAIRRGVSVEPAGAVDRLAEKLARERV